MKTLYFDCRYGISGDMIVGSLLSCGSNINYVLDALESLNISGYKIILSRVEKGIDFDVVIDDNSDHNMKYLYPNRTFKQKNLKKEVFFEKSLKKTEQIVPKRTLKEIKELLIESSLNEKSKDLAFKIFSIIARAEAKAHKIKESEVEFHEKGAMDSIIDIISAVACLESLNVSNVLVSPIYEGYGQIMCRRGLIDIPTPAVKNIAEEFNIRLNKIDFEGEITTPTGIGILAGISDLSKSYDYSQNGSAFTLCEKNENEKNQFTITSTGYGYGKRDYDLPCYLKCYLLDEK